LQPMGLSMAIPTTFHYGCLVFCIDNTKQI
jgi:hypothetical protein